MGDDRVHLQILATLPEFQRRGHGSSLCLWAMGVVLKDGLKGISAMASPMGFQLYSSQGFLRVCTFYIQVPGEEEKLTLEAVGCRRETCADRVLYKEMQ
ncbi:hypothetical protein QBC47DRAFT_385893 [Echria macrotheca]|uniref:N-acetyltransferase domain-containing protein n=1 Tax=Echria macrotheca TaxID=438768 RepID=A0AAJ0FAH1_9PEZI|nr:hypothetical protein QBC47DRAFT_385893 [Echria macrotheca]